MTMREVLVTPPILNSQHTLARQYRLTALAWSIPHEGKETSRIIDLLMLHVLSVDYVKRSVFFHTDKGQNAIAKIEKEMNNGTLELKGNEEPFQQYLVKSLAFGRKWDQIIIEHKLDKMFAQIEYKWQARQFWILYICWSSFKWKEAVYLAFKLLSRSKDEIQLQLLKVKPVDYYREKLHVWLTKDTTLIDKLEDDQVRQLLLSVKQKHDMVTTLGNQKQQHLNLNQSEKHLYNLWLPFLCLKYPTNHQKESFYVCHIRQTIKWFEGCKSDLMTAEVISKLQNKLANVLSSQDNLSDLLYDETEVMLAQGLRDNTEWKQIRERISSLFSVTNFKSMKKSLEISQKTHRLLKNHSQEEESSPKLVQTIRTSSFIPFKQQMQRISEKIENEEESDSELKPTKRLKRLNVGKNKAQLQEIKVFDLTSEQQLMLSLLKMGHQKIKDIQTKYFDIYSTASLNLYACKHKDLILPLAQTELDYFRVFPEKISMIGDPLLKSMIKINLASESTLQIQSKPEQEDVYCNCKPNKENNPPKVDTKVKDAQA